MANRPNVKTANAGRTAAINQNGWSNAPVTNEQPPIPNGPGGRPGVAYLDDNANTWQGALQGVGTVAGGIAGTVAGGPLAGLAAGRLGYSLGGLVGTGIDPATANYKQPSNYILNGNGQLVAPPNPNDPAQLAVDAAAAARARAAGGGGGGTALGTTSSPLTGVSTAPGGGMSTADLAAMFRNYQGQNAPQSAGATLGPTAQAGATYISPAVQAMLQQAQAANVGPAQQAVTQQAGQTTIDPAVMAMAQRANAARINQAQSNQTRAQQEGSIGDLFAASRGQVPSAAEIQLGMSTDRNAANQLGLAAALQGRSVGGALRQASQATGALDASAAGQAAALRAQEQATARDQLSGALSNLRTSDIGVATNQAQLQQAANLQNAQLGTGVNLANAGAANTRAIDQAQLLQQLGTFNAGQANQTSQFNAGQQNQLTAEQAQLLNATNLANMQAGNQVGMFNAGQQNTLSADQAQLLQQLNMFNTGQSNQMNLSGAQLQQNNQQFNANAQLDQTGLNNAKNRALLAAFGQSRGQDITQQDLLARQGLAQQQLNWQSKYPMLAGLAGSGLAAIGSSNWLQQALSGAGSQNPAGASATGYGADTWAPGSVGTDVNPDYTDPSLTSDPTYDPWTSGYGGT